MPFITLSKHVFREWVVVPAVRLYTAKQGPHTRLTIGLSLPLLEEMGWQLSDRIVVQLGTGADLGTFRLSRGDRQGEGMRLAPFGKHACRLNVVLPAQCFGVDVAALFGSASFPLVAQHRRQERSILFSLPETPAGNQVVPLKSRKASA